MNKLTPPNHLKRKVFCVSISELSNVEVVAYYYTQVELWFDGWHC